MKRKLCLLLLALVLATAGCARSGQPEREAPNAVVVPEGPEIPEKLARDSAGIPILRVYHVKDKRTTEMDVETYLEGVLAGEMCNDWPLEALKAQAILARTFVMQFVSEKASKYEEADISTDVSEAQAYDAESVNARIRQAVSETRGLVLCSDGHLIHAWFHAHAGGRTDVPSVGLDYKQGDPDYLASVESPDSDEAPDDVKNWRAVFSTKAIERACADAGVQTGPVQSVEIEDRGASGRATRLLINGKPISAPTLRVNLDAGKLKSTLIDRVTVEKGSVTFSGRGFGHGVGMSQWGAYAMAKDGRNAEAIIRYYFQGVDIVSMWD